MLYEYRERIALAVSFHYGSNHNDKELTFARLHCQRLGIPHKIVALSFFKDLFRSSLLEGAAAIPEGNYDEENMRSTVVPFRNGIMLSIAAGIAENEKLQYIMLANHAGDHTIYPDCRPAFVEAMAGAGRFLKLEEKLIDAGSALSGSGPAFVDLFLEALADGGVACGLPRKQAIELAAQTLLGSAALCLETGKHPGELKDAVCSPGGTTIQGVRALEERGFRGAVIEAVIRTYEKNLKL